MDKYNINFEELFCYDETSPTFLRWIVPRKGRGGKPVARRNNGIAGNFTSDGGVSVNIEGSVFSVKKIVWILHYGKIPEDKDVMFVDGNIANCKISNLRLTQDHENEEKYGEWLGNYLEYDETSPSCLRWKAIWKKGSTIKIGDIAGTCDKQDGYWRIHALGHHLKAHRVVWILCKGEIDPEKYIDHIDGNRSNNKINNLRLINPIYNSQNKAMHRNNNTGINGVAFSERTQPSGMYFSKYTASYYNNGKKVSKSFSIQKYGEELALKKACQWRDKMIELLNENGSDYTTRHGTK